MDGSLGTMTRSVSIFAAMRSKDRIDGLRATLDGLSAANFEAEVGDLAAVAGELTRDSGPDVLFVDLALDDPQQIDLLARVIRDRKSDMAVIATAEHADLDGIRRLMRIGVTDFVPQPFAAVDVRNALESAVSGLARAGGSGGGRGQVVTFIRSCGGVGSTTLAVQTAIEMAGRGKDRHSVALLDLDVQYGNAGLSLDIPSGGMPLILESPDRLDSDFLQASMARHESGVEILAAPDEIVPLNALGPETVTRLVALARDSYERVVCDLPHAWTGWTAGILRASDHVVLVTELSVTALQRSRRLLDLMERQDLAHVPVNIVANHVTAGWGWASRRKEAEKALGHPFDFIVREDRKTAREARDRGVPLRAVSTNSSIIKDVRTMAEALQASLAQQPVLSAKPA